ncbi:hypothetical protein F53441_2425 [Fusarium austroafricanum]|uniref:FAD-binding domain-containing protein n=1 Tax=Fusarium austroafricanum TaxID=2364996 RepID=A0A8H4KRY7_9HYPO|nr:hypothetical protein F53441_2425 [Fusarium austroafricanum]
MASSEHTVVIVGGSVAGLSLANMLEKRGIRYILLEAYDKIAPQIGASIGIHPSGLRILDQLGCAQELMDLIDIPLYHSYIRNPDGSVIRHYQGIHENFAKRHGYPTIFIDRQMLLKALYNNLKSKSSILPGNRVESVREVERGVEVRTAKGEVYRGDVLIGADGIWSTVRKEMWRIGNKKSPGYFPADEWSKVPCYYKCIFGISHPIKALPPGGHYVYNRRFSYLVITGPGGRVYWFLFAKLPTPKFGNDIPRFTKVDEEGLAQEHFSDQITPEIPFKTLYEARISSTLTPLHEHAFEKWHFNRIMTIGDAAHKFEPLTGHGGNCAIETAASLVNHLFAEKASHWDHAHISAAFKAVQDERYERVRWLIKDANDVQNMQAMATPVWAVLAPIMPYFMKLEDLLAMSGSKFVGASRLNDIPMPHRDHTVPFDDELSAKPLPWLGLLSNAFGAVSQGTLFWLSFRVLRLSGIPTTFDGAPTVTSYTGIPIVDSILAMFGNIFGVILASESSWIHMASFMSLLMSTTLDWTIESYRASSAGLFTSYPSIFGLMYQLRGVGKIAPLYHLISVLESALTRSQRPITSHSTPSEVSKSLPISVGLGLVFPSIAFLWPFENKYVMQKVVAFWQPFPLYVSALTFGLSTILRRQQTSSLPAEKHKEPVQDRHEGQWILRHAYTTRATAAAVVHLWIMYKISSNPSLTFSGVFGGLSGLVTAPQDTSVAGSIIGFFQRDMLLNAASVLAHNIYRTLDLRRSGYITTNESVSACLASLVAQPVLGPAAVHIGFLGWREDVLMRTSRQIRRHVY